MKSRSAVTGKYTTAKSAKATPREHYVSDDYPARMLRKLMKILARDGFITMEIETLIANIKRRMGWDKPKPRKVK